MEGRFEYLVAGALSTAAAVGVVVYFTSYVKRKSLLEIFEGSTIQNGHEARRGYQYLEGNFGPQPNETQADELEVVEGKVPADIDGAFARNGPNPRLVPRGGYHWFDGDGMLHVCRIRGGKVQYANRWVQTARIQQEKALGKAYYAKIGDMVGYGGLVVLIVDQLRKLLGVVTQDSSQANTALQFHAGKLLALHEASMPYHIKLLCNGILETVGLVDYTKGFPFTAHPKLSPKTGILHFFGYGAQGRVECKYGQLDASGRLTKYFPIPIKHGGFMHDMAVTENYAIFFDGSLVFDAKRMTRDKALPYLFKRELPARFGLLRVDAESADDIKWFEADAHVVMHTANAWEADGKVYMYACGYDYISLDLDQARQASPPWFCEYIFDPAKGTMVLNYIHEGGEFPVVSPFRTTLPTRYIYAVKLLLDGSPGVYFDSVVKYDVTQGGDCVAAAVPFGMNKYGGEAVFVPRHEKEADMKSEDDGYVMVHVHDESENQSYLHIYDARDLKLLARVKMPQRVPYGFHGLWVPSHQLKAQSA